MADVAKRSKYYSEYTLSALTEALKLSKEKVTPELIKDLGGTLADVAAKSGEYSKYTLPALTAAMTLSKDEITPELIKELGCALADVAAKSGKDSQNTLPALTEEMKNIQSLKGEKLESKEMLAICDVAAKSGWRSKYTLPALTEEMKNIQSLKGEKLESKEILAICDVAAKSGEYSQYTLPALTAAIKSSKDKVTPELIKELVGALADVAAKAGWESNYTLHILPESIKATNLPIAPQLIHSMGGLLVTISQWHKDKSQTLTQAQRLISAYKGPLTEQSLTLLGEGAQLISPSAFISVMELEARRSGPFESVSQLKELISTIESCLKAVPNNPLFGHTSKPELQSTLSQESIAIIERHPPISDLHRLVFSEHNSYGRNDFEERIQNWGDKNLAPALKVTADKEFEIRAKSGAATLRVIPGKELSEQLFKAVSGKVSVEPKKIEDRLKSLYSLAGIQTPAKLPDIETQDGKKEIFLLLKTMPQEKLRSALNAIKPALPVLCGNPINAPGFGDATVASLKEIHDFYGSVITAYAHIDDVLTRKGIKLTKEVKQVVFDNFTKPIKEELDKFRLSGAKETRTVKLVATKNIYDTFYDSIGESCLGNKDIERGDFQPIRLVDPASRDHYGVVYAVKSEIKGIPSLVLFGVEIRREYAYSISQSELMPKLVEQLGLVARENGLREVWTTTNPTRLAQYDVTRNAVLALSKGKPEINSGIQFPSHYSPATKIAKLWG